MDTAKRRISILDPSQPFQFSQAALQDYQDCRRRFQLRYLLKAAWPAPQAEPVRDHERQVRRGERFHRLAQQALLGVPLERLAVIAAADADDLLAQWWDNFTQLLPALGGDKRSIEMMLSAPLSRHRLLAKFDLLILLPGPRIVIYDWKTGLERPRRMWLDKRFQTRVYPYLVTRAASAIQSGLTILPEQVEMIYWFAAHPDQPEHFSYSKAQFERDEGELMNLIDEIEHLPASSFDMTTDERRCSYCVYRSYCDRGISAGSIQTSEQDFEPESEISIDFDQIGEISF